MKNGTTYPFNDLSGYLAMKFGAHTNIFQVYLDSNGMQHFNETKYDEVGLAYSGAQYTWQMFMVKNFHIVIFLLLLTFPQWVASYMSSFAWCGLFLGPKIYRMWKARSQSGAYYQDRLRYICMVPIPYQNTVIDDF